jgi:hypothetical protein
MRARDSALRVQSDMAEAYVGPELARRSTQNMGTFSLKQSASELQPTGSQMAFLLQTRPEKAMPDKPEVLHS